ncbi:MAG: MFS transporter [Actinobacteria bacterium]|nr:MFS transporter [Actinomycetota bacterium]
MDDGNRGLGGRLAEAFHAISRSPRVAAPVVLLVAGNLLYGFFVVLLVPVTASLLGTGKAGYGELTLAFGAGTFAALLLTGRLSGRDGSPMVHVLAVVATGATFALLAAAPSRPAAFCLMAVSGGASMVTDVLATSWLQRSLPDRLVGGVFGVIESMLLAAILLGSWVAPILVRGAGLRPAVVVVGLGVSLLSLATAGSLFLRGQRSPIPGSSVLSLAGVAGGQQPEVF